MSNRFSLMIWRIAYTLEDARQHHAEVRNLWRQAACCVALSLVRVLGVIL